MLYKSANNLTVALGHVEGKFRCHPCEATNDFIWDEFDISLMVTLTGPLVEARLCLATEPEDDSGLAHTLEHLIFQVGFWNTSLNW